MSKSARIGTAYIEIQGDFSKIRQQFAALAREQGAIEIKAVMDKSSVSRTKAQKEALGGDEEFEVKAKVDLGSLIKSRAAVALLTKESARFSDVWNRSSLSIGQMRDLLLFTSPVILDVAGALGALTASLGAAAAGFGALAVGAAGAAATGFGGILAIAGPAISSLTDVMSAQEAANKAQVTGSKSSGLAAMASAQQIRSANEQVETSLRGVETAEEQLEFAQESELLAQEALTQARSDAVRQLQDMRRAAIKGETAEERARLSLKQDNENLNQLLMSGTATALQLADADLAIVEARQNLRDVTIDSNRAQQDYNKAQRGGINEMPGVVSAQQSLDSAVRGVEEAQQGVADAHRDVAKALQNLSYQQKQANQATVAGGTSMAALALAQKKAGPVVVEFAKRLKELGRDWRGLTREGRDDFFRMLTDGVNRLNEKLPLLARSANRSMSALRDGFNDFLDRATGPEFDHFIRVMTGTFAKSIGPVSRAFGNIAKVLQRIAVAVAPDIIRMARGFEEMTKGWVDSTRNARHLRETIHGLVKHTEAWWDLLVAAKDLIVAVLVPGMGEGKKAVKGMTDQLKEWTDWVNAHPKEIKDFFKEALETTRRLAVVLVGFLPSFFQIATAMRPLARGFLAILKGLNSLKLGNVSALTVLLGAFIVTKALIFGAKFIAVIKGITTALIAMRTAALGAAAANTAATAAGAAGGLGRVAAGAAPAAAGTAAGTAMGAAFAVAVPAAIIAAGTFTKGGLLDTIQGEGSADAGEVLGDKLGTAYADKFEAFAQRIPGKTVDSLQRSRGRLRAVGEELGRLTGTGVDEGMLESLRRTADHLRGEINARIQGMQFGSKFAEAIASSRRPVRAATGGLIEQFQKLNFAARDTFFENVHQYVRSLVRTEQISKREGRRIENYWGRVREREAKAWDRFVDKIKTGFRNALTDFHRFAQDFSMGSPREKRRARGQARRGAAEWGAFLGGGNQHGGLVTPQGVISRGIIPQGFQTGGIVGRRRRRPGIRDTVPAMLEVGELIIPKKMVDETRKSAKKTALVLTDEIGEGYEKVSDDSKDFVKRHGKSMETLRKTAAAQTEKFRKGTVDDFDRTGDSATERTKRMRANVVEGFAKMRASSVEQSGKMKSGVGEDFRNLTGAVGDGLRKIAQMTNSALKALGVKKVNFNISTGRDGGARRQTGGMVVPGSGSGDTVPVQAMVEPGEVLAVLNREAAKKWMAWNDEFPRHQQGGIVDRTGVPHFAGGGWVGDSPVGLNPAVRSIAQWAMNRYGVYASDTVASRASSSFHPSGGAVDLSASASVMLDAAKGLVRAFQPKLEELIHTPLGYSISDGQKVAAYAQADHYDHVHIAALGRAVAAVAKRIKEVILEGPEGPLKDMGQAALDKVRGAANAFISDKAPRGGDLPASIAGLGGAAAAQALRTVGPPRGGPSPYGGPTYTQDQIAQFWTLAGGARGRAHVMSAVAMAESQGDPDIVNSIGATGLWQVRPAPIHPWISTKEAQHPFLNAQAAVKILATEGLTTSSWAVWPDLVQRYLKQGGMVPYVGSFAGGGEVKRDGLAMVHKGEKVLPKPTDGLTMHQVLRGLKRALSEGGKELRDFLNKFHRRLERMDKGRLREFLRKLNDWGGPAAKKMAAIVREELHEAPRRRHHRPRPVPRGDGLLPQPRLSLGELRRQRHHLRDDLRDTIERDDLNRKQMLRLVKSINAQIEANKEQTEQTRELRRAIHEHNELYGDVKSSTATAVRGLSNFVASEVGGRGLQKTRNAGWGVDRRY